MKSRIDTIRTIEFVRRITAFISREETGCHRKFAKKLDLSVLELKRYLAIINKEKNDLVYSKAKKTFYFKKKGISRLSGKNVEIQGEIIGVNNINKDIIILN